MTATTVQKISSAFCSHAGSESHGVSSFSFTRLIGAFHNILLILSKSVGCRP
ncbi:hypothetical protein Chls_188 [Chlamydia suis]|uniref:Uncharacterized protein n=1 Tax=Chlamydia suis TaxID=83559 RepID=A0ABX6IQ89_9CHLA|nr:hypothetical protein Chls_188 [Chlamydia suis]